MEKDINYIVQHFTYYKCATKATSMGWYL